MKLRLKFTQEKNDDPVPVPNNSHGDLLYDGCKAIFKPNLKEHGAHKLLIKQGLSFAMSLYYDTLAPH